MYIAIEGLKGTGKSTLVRLLQSWLSAKGIDFDLLCPNQAMPKDHWLEKKALLPEFSERDGFNELLYTTRAHYHKQHADFQKQLILGDQSIFSHIVARWHRAALVGMKSYVNQNRREYNLPWPDHVVMLSLPIETLRNRLISTEKHDQDLSGDTDDLIQQLNAAHHAFLEIEQNAKFLGFGHVKWHHVDANQPLNDLIECIGSQIVVQLNATSSPKALNQVPLTAIWS